MTKSRSVCFLLLQVCALFVLHWLCELAADALSLGLPGSVLGLGVLLVLLATRVVPEAAVQLSSAWLLGELLLFFLPPVVSVLKYQDLLQDGGWRIGVHVVLGTLIALSGTAWVVERVCLLEGRMAARRKAGSHDV